MRDCNRLWIKKEEIERAIQNNKMRYKLFKGEKCYLREDIANLLIS